MQGTDGDQATVSGTWNNNSDSTYSYTTIPTSKAYKLSSEITDTRFDNTARKVISVKPGSTGKDRFYVMALENVDSNGHFWYYNAYENMSDYATATSVDFGKGIENTYTMINKWNNRMVCAIKSRMECIRRFYVCKNRGNKM